MKRSLIGFIFALASLSTPAFAHGKSIMMEFSYGHVLANRNYTTSLYRVYDAPVYTRNVKIETRGEYCNLVINGVDYTRFNGDYLQRAYPNLGSHDGTWAIPDGPVRAIQIDFTQTYWTNVDCEIKVYAVD